MTFVHTKGHSQLVSVGSYLPERRVTTRELLMELETESRFDIPIDWIERAMGIREKRVVDDDVEPSDMAAHAAREALEIANLTPNVVDAIVYTGVDRDYVYEPATAHFVQKKLGADRAIVFDVSNACHGFMNGIHLMDALIATGQVRTGLVVTGERGSTATRDAMKALRVARERDEFYRLVGGLTVGDAGAAVLLRRKTTDNRGFLGFMLQSQGRHATLCTYGKPGGVLPMETDMASIVREGIAMLTRMYREFMAVIEWKPSDIHRFVHHQVGTKVFRQHAAYSGVPKNIMTETVSHLGNLVTASIPINLYTLQSCAQVGDGDRVFISGAGSGLSVSQSALVWGVS